MKKFNVTFKTRTGSILITVKAKDISAVDREIGKAMHSNLGKDNFTFKGKVIPRSMTYTVSEDK